MKKDFLFHVFFLLSFLLFNNCQSSRDKIDGNLKKTSNRKELDKVISHYQSKGDSLKIKAAFFLIENMPGLKTVTTKWVNEKGEEYDATKILEYPSLVTFREAMDSMGYYQVIDSEVEDIESITSDYLINNIDWAFYAWKFLPYSKDLNFDEFCEYILPYRIGTEKLVDWRSPIIRQYEKEKESFDNLINIKNKDIVDWYKTHWNWDWNPDDSTIRRWRTRLIFESIVSPKCGFDIRSDALNPHLNYQEMNNYKIGDCVDQAHYFSFIMKALGIYAVHDFMPTWGNRSGTHHANGLYDHDGTIRPVHLLYTAPGHHNKAAKVFRKTFSIQKNSLAEIVNDKSLIPPFFRNNRMVDVTSEHCKVSDIEVKFNSWPTEDEYAYLSVYSEGQYIPVYWGKVNDNGKVLFKDMADEIIYFPIVIRNYKYYLIDTPVVVSEGKLRKLEYTNSNIETCIFTKIPNFDYKGTLRLYCFRNKKWSLLQEKINVTDTIIQFDNIPTNDILKITRIEDNYTCLYTINNRIAELRYFDK